MLEKSTLIFQWLITFNLSPVVIFGEWQIFMNGVLFGWEWGEVVRDRKDEEKNKQKIVDSKCLPFQNC